jgi:uncharacterized membrane protein
MRKHDQHLRPNEVGEQIQANRPFAATQTGSVGQSSEGALGVSWAASNITTITRLEKEAMDCRSSGERLGDAIARQAGRSWFIMAHAIWFGGWIFANANVIPGIKAFDPFPYQFLTLVVSLEAIFLSLFILMSQNRANRQADSRAHLDLQINLLTEQESTKILQTLQRLCAHLHVNLEDNAELDALTSTTKPEELLQELKEKLPEAC